MIVYFSQDIQLYLPLAPLEKSLPPLLVQLEVQCKMTDPLLRPSSSICHFEKHWFYYLFRSWGVSSSFTNVKFDPSLNNAYFTNWGEGQQLCAFINDISSPKRFTAVSVAACEMDTPTLALQCIFTYIDRRQK